MEFWSQGLRQLRTYHARQPGWFWSLVLCMGWKACCHMGEKLRMFWDEADFDWFVGNSARGWCALHLLAVWGDWCATAAGWFAGARSWPGLWFKCLVMSFLGSSGSSQVHKAHVKCTQIQQPNPFNYFQPMILASRCRNLSLHKTPMWQTHINLYANPTIYPLRYCHQWVAKMIRKW